jgi:hypothetical protein
MQWKRLFHQILSVSQATCHSASISSRGRGLERSSTGRVVRTARKSGMTREQHFFRASRLLDQIHLHELMNQS